MNHMQKAKEIADKHNQSDAVYKAALEMAQWKQEQMIEILRNMEIEDDDIVDYSNEYQCTPDYGFSEKFIKRFKKAMETD